MQKNKRRTNKVEKGITLVALVVTIIILLILAGVTLNLVLSNNGLIGRVKQGAGSYKNASLNEQAELDRGAEIIEEIADELEPGQKIKDKDGNKITADEISNHYGDKVTYNGKEYQLFYYDKDGKFGDVGRIYLQSTSLTGGIGTRLSDHYENTGLADKNSLIYKLNPSWSELVGESLITADASSLDDNIKGVAYLCNPTNWSDDYVTAEDKSKGAWAIGGVSAEMFCASYNEKIQPEVEFGAKAYSETLYSRTTTGYKFKPGDPVQYTVNEEGYGCASEWKLSNDYDGMYWKGGNVFVWISSPSALSYESVCSIHGTAPYLGAYDTGRDFYLRILVSLPSNIQIKLK